jgi:hypothetical protein
MMGKRTSTWQSVTRAVQLVSLISMGVTLPIGVAEFYVSRVEAQRNRIEDHYDQLDQRYIDFERLCLEHIELDCADAPMVPPPALSSEDRIKQQLIYNVLLSILERAYLKYNVERLDSRRTQWEGWDAYSASFVERAAFRELWKEQGNEYDECFQDYMNAKVEEFERAAIPAVSRRPCDNP